MRPVGEALPTDQEIETPDMIEAAPAATDHTAVDEGSVVSEPVAEGDQPVDSTGDATSHTTTSNGATGSRKPNKFMADLTRAMQGAAETAKADTLARFTADAKTHIETIHASTALESTELRKQADDDVAGIREWSKAEIARIREETDERITHRKARLEREIDAHAAEIEGRIERVQRRVDAFEAEMAAFFERLLAEEDPTRFAAMAESLPEPPPFDIDEPDDETNTAGETVAQVTDLPAERDRRGRAVARGRRRGRWRDDRGPGRRRGRARRRGRGRSVAHHRRAGGDRRRARGRRRGRGRGPMPRHREGVDPRLDALANAPDFAAAEAEAAAFTPEEAQPGEDIAVIADDALAARLAGLVPDAEAAGTESLTTRVVVTGLVSVASIAGFKRQLSRVAGVNSVGVSSGPDGEFLFAVTHDASLVLRDTVTTLPGFGARVTAEGENELTVVAKDPEGEG